MDRHEPVNINPNPVVVDQGHVAPTQLSQMLGWMSSA
jgi:hypothetical protein